MTRQEVEPKRSEHAPEFTDERRRMLSTTNDFVRLAITLIPELNKKGKVNADDVDCVKLFQYVARHMEVTAYYKMRRLAGEPTHTLSDVAGISRTTQFDLNDESLRTGTRDFYVFRSGDLDGIKQAVEKHGSGLVLIFGQPFGPEEAVERAQTQMSITDGNQTYVISHTAFAMSPEYLHLILEDGECRASFTEASAVATEIGYKPATEGNFSLLQAHVGSQRASIDDFDD